MGKKCGLYTGKDGMLETFLTLVYIYIYIYMSSNCYFYLHISNLAKRTKHLTGWMLRTFSSRDKLTMLTLFKALVMT